MLDEHVQLHKACIYVLRSRKHKTIHVKVEAHRELFNPSRQFKYRDMFGEEVIVESSIRYSGSKAQLHRCDMTWIKHPTKTGLPVSTSSIRVLMNNLINHYDD